MSSYNVADSPLLESSQVDQMNLEPVHSMWTKWFSLRKDQHASCDIISCIFAA